MLFFITSRNGINSKRKTEAIQEKVNSDPIKRNEYLKKMLERAKWRRENKIEKSIGDSSDRGNDRMKWKKWKDRNLE